MFECSVCYNQYKTQRPMPCKHNVCSKCLDKIIPKVSRDVSDNSQRCPMCRIQLVRLMFQKKVCYDEPQMVLGDYNKETGDYNNSILLKLMPKFKTCSYWLTDIFKAMGPNSNMFIYIYKVEYYNGTYDYTGAFVVSNPVQFYLSPAWTYYCDNRYTTTKGLINALLSE